MIFMVIVGVFLLYLVAGYFVYQLFIDLGFRKNIALLISGILMIVVPFGDVLPGRLYTKYLCYQDGGVKINKVADTDGYLALDNYLYGCGSGCV